MTETALVCCRSCGTETETEELEWEEDEFGRKGFCPDCGYDKFDAVK